MFDAALQSDALRENSLEFVWLEITEKCNLQCKHCYASSSPYKSLQGEMTLSDWKNVIDQTADLGCRKLQLIGGEPTIHPYFREIICHAREREFTLIEVYTNATRLTERLTEFFMEKRVSLATSFYTSVPEIHDEITLQTGSWRKTVGGIKTCLERNIPIRVGVVAVNGYEHEVDSAIAFLEFLGVSTSRIGIDGQRRVGRGANTSRSSNVEGEQFSELCGYCGENRLCIAASGSIYPCVFSRKTQIGNILKNSHTISQTLVSEGLARFKESLHCHRSAHAAGMAGCDPNLPCSPQTCSPHLPCGPQVFCNPDAACSPQLRGGASSDEGNHGWRSDV